MSDTLGVFIIRAAQAIALSLPTLLAGMLMAGFLRAAVEPDRIRRWFKSPLHAWPIAVAMPVCAIGVIPVLFALGRARVRPASIVTVALAGPALAPWTLGYLADNVGIPLFALLVGVQFAMCLLVGFAVEAVTSRRDERSEEHASVSTSLLAIAREAGRSLDVRVLALMLLVALGAGTVATLIPANGIGGWLVDRSPEHATMIGLATQLTYAPPSILAMQAGQLITSSTMPGLLVPVILIGSAVTLALPVLAFVAWGWKPSAVALAVLLVVAVGGGLAVDAIVYDDGRAVEDSHAFEDHGRPYHLFDHADGPLAGAWFRFSRPLGVHTAVALGGILAIALLGRSMSPRPATAPLGRVPVMLATAAGAVGIIVLNVYAYFPPPASLRAELDRLASEASSDLIAGDVVAARQAIEEASRRLDQYEASSLLRAAPLNERSRESVRLARAEAERLLASLARPTTQPSVDGEPTTLYRLVRQLSR